MQCKRTFISLVIILYCSTQFFSQEFIEPKYPELLEPDSELITSGYNYTVERIHRNKYIFKAYWDDIPDIAMYCTFDYKDFNTYHGPYAIFNEDGSINTKGEYNLDEKHGFWQESGNKKGYYNNGEKTGEWITQNEANKLVRSEKYKEGKLNGEVVDFDDSGTIINRQLYRKGELIEGAPLPNQEIIAPTFPGCNPKIIGDSTFIKCSKELIQNHFAKMKYPSRARNEGIQGMVVVRFTVDLDGKIKDVMPVYPAPEILTDAVIKTILSMPDFNPALKNGIPVKHWLTFKCPFKIDGDDVKTIINTKSLNEY